MKKLQDRVDIVAGSGRAIGQALALNLARKGARVMVNDLDTAPAASK
jgi:3-oxoacyl-[acyl-carrier protein] reductase